MIVFEELLELRLLFDHEGEGSELLALAELANQVGGEELDPFGAGFGGEPLEGRQTFGGGGGSHGEADGGGPTGGGFGGEGEVFALASQDFLEVGQLFVDLEVGLEFGGGSFANGGGDRQLGLVEAAGHFPTARRGPSGFFVVEFVEQAGAEGEEGDRYSSLNPDLGNK